MADYLLALPQWDIKLIEGVPRLFRDFGFKNYAQGLAFVNNVANLAEAEGHHPLLILEVRKVHLQWWTHKIKWLHVNDFIMAAKSDEIFFNQLSKN